VSDSSALTNSASALAIEPRGKWATIGPKPLVDLVAPWAMWTLVANQPPRTGVLVTIYPAALLTRYQGELAAARTQFATNPMGPSLVGMLDGIIGLAGDSDHLELTVDANADRGWMEWSVAPKAGTDLAKFVAQQSPSDYGLLADLPAGAFGAAGRLTLGPFRDRFLELTKQLYGAFSANEVIAAAEGLMKASTGEFAVGVDVVPGSPMHFVELFGLSDHKAGTAAVDGMVGALGHAHSVSVANIDTTYTLGPDSTYDGVVLHEVDSSVDVTKLPADQKASIDLTMPGGKMTMQMGVRDRLAVFGTHGDAARAIDLIHGTVPRTKLSGAVASLIEASRQRKDSAVMVMHLDRLLPSSSANAADLVMTLGFASHALRLHVDVLASLIAALVHKP
jgi:hypothetical protein